MPLLRTIFSTIILFFKTVYVIYSSTIFIIYGILLSKSHNFWIST